MTFRFHQPQVALQSQQIAETVFYHHVLDFYFWTSCSNYGLVKVTRPVIPS